MSEILTDKKRDDRLIPGLETEPSTQDMADARDIVSEFGYEHESWVQQFAPIIAALRVRERRAGMEGAAKLMCELCRKGNICSEGDDTTLYFHDLQDELEPREWCEASDIWAALAARDAAVAEREKGEPHD